MGGMMPPGPGMPPMMPGMPPGNQCSSIIAFISVIYTSVSAVIIILLKFINMLCHCCCGALHFTLYNGFLLLVSGMPPPVGHRTGIAHLAQVPPAANMLTRPVVPAATVPSAQPDVTKPLFPSAGQVQCL